MYCLAWSKFFLCTPIYPRAGIGIVCHTLAVLETDWHWFETPVCVLSVVSCGPRQHYKWNLEILSNLSGFPSVVYYYMLQFLWFHVLHSNFKVSFKLVLEFCFVLTGAESSSMGRIRRRDYFYGFKDLMLRRKSNVRVCTRDIKSRKNCDFNPNKYPSVGLLVAER